MDSPIMQQPPQYTAPLPPLPPLPPVRANHRKRTALLVFIVVAALAVVGWFAYQNYLAKNAPVDGMSEADKAAILQVVTSGEPSQVSSKDQAATIKAVTSSGKNDQAAPSQEDQDAILRSIQQ